MRYGMPFPKQPRPLQFGNMLLVVQYIFPELLALNNLDIRRQTAPRADVFFATVAQFFSPEMHDRIVHSFTNCPDRPENPVFGAILLLDTKLYYEFR